MVQDKTGQTGGKASRSERKPVTIDLSAEEVARNAAENASAAEASGADENAAAAPVSEAAPAETASADESAAAAPDAENPAGPTEPEPAALPHEEARVHPMLPLVGAALLGGAVVALVVIVLAMAGFFRSPPAEATDYGPEIATLKSDVAALKEAPAPTVDLGPLSDRVAALEKSVTALQESASSAAAGAPDAEALKAVQDRLSQLEQSFEQVKTDMASAATPGASGGSTSSESTSSESTGGGGGSDLAARVTALSSEVAALRGSDVSSDLSGLHTSVTDLQTSVEALRQNMDALGQKLAALSTEVAGLPQEARVAAIEQKLDAVGATVDKAAALGPAVAAQALGAAVDAGQPFTSELAALKTLGVDSDAVSALEPHAADGLPTLAALSARFEAAIGTIDLSAPVPEGAGALDRLMESARSLVQVRPAHPTAGSDPAAIVTRIRGALTEGDLKTALAEWETLPQAIKDATAAWAQSAETRKTADDLVARLRGEALARLKSEG